MGTIETDTKHTAAIFFSAWGVSNTHGKGKTPRHDENGSAAWFYGCLVAG
jgi:hypothetical protein